MQCQSPLWLAEATHLQPPNTSGSSRHGEPGRTILRTAYNQTIIAARQAARTVATEDVR